MIKPQLLQTVRLVWWSSEATMGFIQGFCFHSEPPLAFLQQKALKYMTTVSDYYENPFKSRNRLHPWVSSNLTNGQEAEVSAAHHTWHSWLSPNTIWALSLHSIPVKNEKQKEREAGQEMWWDLKRAYRGGKREIRSRGLCVAFWLLNLNISNVFYWGWNVTGNL